MAVEPFPKIGRNDSFEKVRESIGAAFDILEFLFDGGIDSLNIRRLTADLINTGILNAGKVTIRSDLNGGAYIVIDGNGVTVSNGTENTFTVDNDGNVTINDGTIRLNLNGGAYIQLSSNGMVVNNGALNTVEIDINGNAMFRGDIVAGADIDITSDARIGDNLYLNAASTGDKGIIFNNSSGATAGEIRVQSGDMSITTGGFITLTIGSTQGLVINQKVTAPIFNATTAVTVNNSALATEQFVNTGLAGKANAFTGFTGVVGTGTNSLSFTNGILISVS